jgi:hypothetical protein
MNEGTIGMIVVEWYGIKWGRMWNSNKAEVKFGALNFDDSRVVLKCWCGIV